MQLDREGIDDTKQGRQPTNANQTTINLSKHFLENGLSQSAYNKIAPEIENGDMNVSILIDCNDNELDMMANQYNFTFLQKKAFIKAVNSLKLHSKKKDNGNSMTGGVNSNEPEVVAVYLSLEEQSMLNEVNKLVEILGKYRAQCVSTKEHNLNEIKSSILKLENCKKLLIQSVDEVINKLVKTVCFLYCFSDVARNFLRIPFDENNRKLDFCNIDLVLNIKKNSVHKEAFLLFVADCTKIKSTIFFDPIENATLSINCEKKNKQNDTVANV